MEKVAIYGPKNQIGAYLTKVKPGSSVLILDRDQPVTRVEMLEPGCPEDDRIARLERAGLVRRGSGEVPLQLLRRSLPRARRSPVPALPKERAEVL